jgi:CDP-glucose 4,6-dehydratase
MNNKSILLRNPKFNRPWQFVLEPLKGYIILAKKQYENPSKYSGAWNFGTESKAITDVKTVVKYMIKFWGSGDLKVLNKNKFYEQHNLQLDIKKAKKILYWKPTYNVEECIKVTTNWYYKVLKEKMSAKNVTDVQIQDYMNENRWN